MISDLLIRKIELFHKFANIETSVIHKQKVVYSTYHLENIEHLPIYEKTKDIVFSTEKIQMIIYNSFECYGLFLFVENENEYLFFVGPIVTVRPIHSDNLRYLSFYHLYDDETNRKFLKMLPQLNLSQFSNYLGLIFHEITSIIYNPDEIHQNKILVNSFQENDDFSKGIEISEKNVVSNHIYEDIQLYSDVIKLGDLSQLELLFDRQILFSNFNRENPKENLYSFITITALLGNAAVSAGLDFYDSSALGYSMINFAESLSKPSDFIALLKKLIKGYTLQVQNELYKNTYSKPIKKVINYIEKHIHYPISLEDVSLHIKLSRPYLSQLFSKEVGQPLQNYIQDQKMIEAENLIKYSKMSISEIANTLSFCSQSYFTEVFKKSKHMTPLEYRKKNSR